MTFRKFLAVIIALAISVSFCACSSETSTAETDTVSDFESVFSDLRDDFLNELEEDRENQAKFGSFVVLSHINLGDGLEQYILYDSQTMVMFSYVDGYQGGGLTVLYNADGTLRLYSPEDVNETE